MLIFFVFCFVLGRVINGALEKEDGPSNRWSQLSDFAGTRRPGSVRISPVLRRCSRSSCEQLVDQFPTPRLDIDDGEQSTADLHAREDLLLDYYSVSSDDNGAIRIPISRAMELIAQRGLPVSTAPTSSEPVMTGDAKPDSTGPADDRICATGYELGVIAAREQKLAYGASEGATNGREHAGPVATGESTGIA